MATMNRALRWLKVTMNGALRWLRVTMHGALRICCIVRSATAHLLHRPLGDCASAASGAQRLVLAHLAWHSS